MEFEVPLVVNRAFVGNINAKITDTVLAGQTTTFVEIPTARFLELVKNFANQDQLDSWLGNNLDPSTYLALAELRRAGLEISFDPSSLTIGARIPRLGTQKLSVRGARKPILEDHHRQSGLASGMSFYVRNRYNHDASRGLPKGFGDTEVDVSGFTSIGGFGGWSLFYEADFKQNDEQEFARKDVTLIHDDYERGLRYAIGDIRPTVSRFQSSTDMLGVSLERNYSDINPFRNLRPSGRSTFTLERESTVSFEVNGVIVSTEILEPGTYSIEDFPLAIGSNDVRVLIDDGTSRVEAADFSTYVDTTLLANGVTNFGISAGVQRERGSGRGRTYQDDPAVMGFYEKGVTENLTLGTQVEVASDHALLSSNAIYGSRLGVVGIEAAVSKRDGHDTGVASLLRYKYQGISKNRWFMQSDVQAAYRSDSFLSLSESVSRPEEWSLNARTSFGKNGLSLTFGGEVRTVADVETQRLSATLSKSFPSFSLSLGYQYIESDRGDGSSDNKFSLSISKRLENSTLRGQYKSLPQETRAEWRTKSARNVGDTRSRVTAISTEDSNTAELEFGYVNSRFEVDMRHSTSIDKASSETDLSNTNLTLAGGVGYADGKFAFGRPFTNGFMVVDRHKSLRGKKVFVTRNSTSGDAVTSTKTLGTALVPLSNSYRTQRYLFSVNDLPIGYDLGSGDVRVYPGNLAGFKYSLGSDSANTVIGKVLSPAGEPLSLMSGTLVPINGGDDIIVFTNRTGRFVAEKMGLGRYTLIFGDSDQWTSEIEVIEGDEPGLVQVGTITLESAQ